MKNTKGFTLVELVIVIIIVGILSIVAVPIYKGYTKKAAATEGWALLGSVQTAEKVYFAEFSKFAPSTNSEILNAVNTAQNKYFKNWGVASSDGSSWSATATGESDSIVNGVTLHMWVTGTAAAVQTKADNL